MITLQILKIKISKDRESNHNPSLASRIKTKQQIGLTRGILIGWQFLHPLNGRILAKHSPDTRIIIITIIMVLMVRKGNRSLHFKSYWVNSTNPRKGTRNAPHQLRIIKSTHPTTDTKTMSKVS